MNSALKIENKFQLVFPSIVDHITKPTRIDLFLFLSENFPKAMGD